MSSFEQKLEMVDKSWMYLLFAADPYEVIAFKVRGSVQCKERERWRWRCMFCDVCP